MKRAIAILVYCAGACLSAHAAEQPETVMLRFQAKAGAEEELAKVIQRHWKTARELKLVRDAPHTTVQSSQDGKVWFVDIFTWRDAEIPDHAPAAIQAIWAEMSKLTESRGGRPGIEITAVELLTGGR